MQASTNDEKFTIVVNEPAVVSEHGNAKKRDARNYVLFLMCIVRFTRLAHCSNALLTLVFSYAFYLL